MKLTVSLKNSYSRIEPGRETHTTCSVALRECGRHGGSNNHMMESHSKGEVQEGQKFYGYKHPLKQAWGRGEGGGGSAPNPENQF